VNESATKQIQMGGMAVIEGVMMRGPDQYAVAVRKPDGDIVVRREKFKFLGEKFKIFKIPILRGAVTLIETLFIGYKSLTYSAEMAMDEEKASDREMRASAPVWSTVSLVGTVVFALALGMFIFFYVPLILTDLVGVKGGVAFNLVDGIFRVSIFLVYVLLISLWGEFKRVLQYHGAEHKTIYVYEDKRPLVPAEAQKYSTLHPRCGTTFLMIVMFVSIFVFMFTGRPEGVAERLMRLPFVPLIGGISYEIIKLMDKLKDSSLGKLVIAPGLYLQKLTTRQPSDDQVEVAIAALRAALNLDNEQSDVSVREPLVAAGLT